ncbi:Polysaccharide deacetylase [Pseudoruegeria aquimaris]|uniref:Chitooligosaccharide deacetylase n=1 Tax=Pseudoruegeria aquimaris TaxID=393663 RepID=A0A1Y5TC60_9RHOB|nr:polysaccharide deacetylase family protein [Pseudoruegeria aquimaris]SLN60619.1 Polysaccharide deacetylase [Pseudoruegeria aquimaris]
MGRSAICLTFDDRHISHWRRARGLLAAYAARATFFVSGPDKLGDEDFAALDLLAGDGHEIAYHTMTHPRASEFLATGSAKVYMEREIDPGLEILRRRGFAPESFAFPYHEAEETLIAPLLRRFRILRRLGPADRPAGRVYDGSGHRMVDCIGSLDMASNPALDETYYAKRFRQIGNRQGVGVFCGHAICAPEEAGGARYMRPEDLDWFLWAAREKGLRSVPISSLA